MASIVPDVHSIQKHGIVVMVLWTNSSKRGEFHHFTVTERVSGVVGLVGRVVLG